MQSRPQVARFSTSTMNPTARSGRISQGIGGATPLAIAENGLDIMINDIPDKDDVSPRLKHASARGGRLFCKAHISERAPENSPIGERKVQVNNAGVAQLTTMDILQATEDILFRRSKTASIG